MVHHFFSSSFIQQTCLLRSRLSTEGSIDIYKIWSMYLKKGGRSELRLELNCSSRWKAMSTLLAPFLSLGGRACMCHSSHFLSSLPLRKCASAELTLFTHSSFLDRSSFPSQFFYHLGGKDSCDHFFILPLFYLWDKQ